MGTPKVLKYSNEWKPITQLAQVLLQVLRWNFSCNFLTSFRDEDSSRFLFRHIFQEKLIIVVDILCLGFHGVINIPKLVNLTYSLVKLFVIFSCIYGEVNYFWILLEISSVYLKWSSLIKQLCNKYMFNLKIGCYFTPCSLLYKLTNSIK